MKYNVFTNSAKPSLRARRSQIIKSVSKKIFLYIILMVITSMAFSQNVYVVTKTTDPSPFTDPYKFNDADCDPDMLGTLQWAINKSNDDNAESVIEFNIPGSGVQEIISNSYFPQIMRPVVIDGTTQPGYSTNSPSIKISGQFKVQFCFNVYNTNVTIKGLHMANFANNAILLNNSSNTRIIDNIITNIFAPGIGIQIISSNFVEVYGNRIEVDALNTSGKAKYGVYVDKSENCIIGGTAIGQANTIANCTKAGVTINGYKFNKISGNIIYNNPVAIQLGATANDNIQPPVITSYTNRMLSGTAIPNSTVEVFSGTGAENANEYLGSTIADDAGDWVTYDTYGSGFFTCTQTSSLNNTSALSAFFINPLTTQLLSMFQNADSIDLDDFLYAKKIDGAIKYQFNIVQVDSDVNQIITKDDNYFSLLELQNNEAYYDKEYKIKVRAIFEEDTTDWGNTTTIKSIQNQRYEYGKIILRTKQGTDGIINPYNNSGGIVPIFTDGFTEMNHYLNVSNIERTFNVLLPKLPDLYNIYTLEFEQSFSTDSVVAYFNDTSIFQYAERVPIFELLATGDDPSFEDGTQWHLLQEHLNAMETWAEIPENNNIITIAIVDDAIRLDHPDLVDNIFIDTRELSAEVIDEILTLFDYNANHFVDANEFVAYCKSIYDPINNLIDVYNFQDHLPTIYNNTDGNDNSIDNDIFGYDAADEDLLAQHPSTNIYHGTHVAGIAAGVTNNDIGIASLSNNKARIIPVKIKNDDNNSPGSINAPYEGIVYAISVEPDIVNLSLGVNPLVVNVNALEDLMTAAFNNLGIVFVVASGNTFSNLEPPSYFENVVSVGATNVEQQIAEYSNHGPNLDFFAPGSDIFSTYCGDVEIYGSHSGTSMACPQVSALWALLKSINPNATFDQIYNCFASSSFMPENWSADCSETPGPLAWSTDISMHGIINPKDAVLCFLDLDPVAMFEHVGSLICPEADFNFYSISSGGPITSDMEVLWSCSDLSVDISSPTALNTNISFPSEGIYTIVFTIYDIMTHEPISYYQDDIIVTYPSVEISNVGNFTSCIGFEVPVFLTFSGNPPFRFNYTYDEENEYSISDIQSHNYTLYLSGSEGLNTGTYTLKIINIGDNSCSNVEDIVYAPFQITECDLCSRNHNNIIAWQKGQFHFDDNLNCVVSSPQPDATLSSESSCAITNENRIPLILMRGDNLFNIWSTNYVNITESYYGTPSNFGNSSLEGSLILPHDTGNPDLYYALVVSDYGSSFTESLRYYVIDVNNPTNMHIVNSEAVSNYDEEVMIACKISDDYGYWILTNTRNSETQSIGSNKLNLYKLQNNELQFIGTIEVQYLNTVSHMCFSPNMNLLAIREDQCKTSIYNFNRELNCPIESRLSLIKTIDHIAFQPRFYEFSPNSQLLYTTGYDPSIDDESIDDESIGRRLLQFEIYSPNIEPSYIKDEFLLNMRLGLDDKLYLGKYTNGDANIISQIRAPNVVGEDCSYNGSYYTTEISGSIDLSRKTAEIPLKFTLNEETVGCQHNITIENLTGYEPFTYLWSTGTTENHLNNVSPEEVYSVTVSDMYLCSYSETLIVTDFTTVTASINSTHNVCYGTANTGEVYFSINGGTAPYTVDLIGADPQTLYAPTATDYSFSGLVVSDYSIIVTDHNGCQFEAAFSLDYTTEMLLTLSVLNIPCEGLDNGSAHVEIQNGESPYTILWSSGEEDQTAINLIGGSAEVLVTDNFGCEANGNILIPVHEVPVINLTATPAVICSGGTAELTAITTGGVSPYTYTWSPDLPNPEVNEVAPTTNMQYYVTVSDQNGCTAGNDLIVEVENIQINNNIDYEYGNSTGTVDFVFIPEVNPVDYFSQITIENNQTSEVFDFTEQNDPYTLDAGYNYTASFVSINGCNYTNDFSIDFVESFICSLVESKPVTCDANYNGVVIIDIQGGVSPYVVSFSYLDYAYNNTFNSAGQYELDLNGMTPNIPFDILIEDNNGEIFTLEFGGLSYAWTYTLTNSTLGVQNNFANLSIQIGDVNDQTLNIPHNVTFTNCTIYTATQTYSNVSETQWTVAAPFDLILDNCVIQSGCPDLMWQGIFVVGAHAAQNETTHAMVVVKNGTNISDAMTAIEANHGAIVKASDSYFYNNQYDIYFQAHCKNQYLSYINYNQFITDRMLNNNYIFPKAHVYLDYTKNLRLKGNTFSNTIVGSPLLPPDVNYTADKRGKGIEAYLSSFIVTPVSILDYNNYAAGSENTFTGLYYAIDAQGQKSYAPQIYHSIFKDNFRGVHIKGTDGARVLFNYISSTNENMYFNMVGYSLNGTPNTDVSYAAYLNSAKNTKFEENTIVNGKAGAYVYNLGNDGTQYYNNNFGLNPDENAVDYNIPQGMRAATVVVGKNSDYVYLNAEFPGLNGLQVKCNDYTDNDFAISVVNGNMRKNQGTQYGQTDQLAGNQFHEDFVNGMEFKAQEQNSTPFYYSHLNLGTYRYYQHDDDDIESIENGYYRMLKEENIASVEGIKQDGIEYSESESCPSHYSQRVFNHDLAISEIALKMGELDNLEREYNRILDKGDMWYMKSVAKLMNYENYNDAYEILQNEGFLSDTVLIALICNEIAPNDAIAAILIENSPLPEKVIQLIEDLPINNNIKNWLSFYSAGLSARVEMEYEISDVRQEIIVIEGDLISNAINNDSLPDVKIDVLSYFNSKPDISFSDYKSIYNLEISMEDFSAALGTLNNIRQFASTLPAEESEDLVYFCDVNQIYLGSRDEKSNDSILAANKELLFEAASRMSPDYSAMAEILYSQTTDSVFYEYTPLPFEEVTPKNFVVTENPKSIFTPEFKVYPNPTKGMVIVEYNFERVYENGTELLLKALNLDKQDNCKTGEINVFNSESKYLNTISLDMIKGMATIDLNKQVPGIYLIDITDCYGNKNSVKIVKQ